MLNVTILYYKISDHLACLLKNEFNDILLVSISINIKSRSDREWGGGNFRIFKLVNFRLLLCNLNRFVYVISVIKKTQYVCELFISFFFFFLCSLTLFGHKFDD